MPGLDLRADSASTLACRRRRKSIQYHQTTEPVSLCDFGIMLVNLPVLSTADLHTTNYGSKIPAGRDRWGVLGLEEGP
jgi:hypothetical protein